MGAIVRTVLDDFASAATEREIHFAIGDLPPAHCDAATIERVWINLVENAVKYSGSRTKPRVEIGATRSANETTYFVRDNGVGFDMQYVDKLFSLFQRLHGAEFEGTGIGLALVKRIIGRHGGRVWAEAKPDAGATFFFSLPERKAPDG